MIRYLFVSVVLLSGSSFAADLSEMPADAAFYLHVNIEGMRSYPAGQPLYDWLSEEALDEVREETGIAIGEELNSVTVLAYDEGIGTVLLRGPLSSDARDQLLSLANENGAAPYGNHPDAFVIENEGRFGRNSADQLYFSLNGPDLIVITTRQSDMDTYVDTGDVFFSQEPGSSLIVLRADRSLVQGGMRNAGEFADKWDSSVMKNMEEAALLVADQGGDLSLQAQVRATTPAIAASMGAVVEGLLALKHLAIEEEPELAALLQEVQVGSNGDLLSIEALVEADALVDILD